MEHLDLTGRFTDAVGYALAAHDGQVRKGTRIPYASHLLAVSALVLEHGGDELQATAAILHDVVEDCGGRPRLDEVRERFGPRVAELVEALSDSLGEDPSTKAPWRRRKEDYLEHLGQLARQGHPAALVALCDKLHNARAIVADASDPEGPGAAVWDRFSADPSGVAWYYRSLAGILAASPALPTRARRELQATVQQLVALAADADDRATPPQPAAITPATDPRSPTHDGPVGSA